MKARFFPCFPLVLLLASRIFLNSAAQAQSLPAHQQLARDIHKELVEINTVTATGDTFRDGQKYLYRLVKSLAAAP